MLKIKLAHPIKYLYWMDQFEADPPRDPVDRTIDGNVLVESAVAFMRYTK